MASRLACEPFTSAAEMDAWKNCACDWDRLTLVRDDLIDQVSDIVVMLTGGLITGRCEHTVRPCASYETDCWFLSYECCDVPGVPLPGIDVDVTQVQVNGDVIPADEYFLLDGYRLVRREGYWPSDQTLRRPLGEDNTFGVTFESGFLPHVARMAATELACVIVAWTTGRISALPPGVTSASIDGSFIQVDPSALAMTHTPWMNQLIALYGSRGAAVLSPELSEGWTLHTT